jgi:signal transduction histidine kinase
LAARPIDETNATEAEHLAAWLSQLGEAALSATLDVRVNGRVICKRGVLPADGVSTAAGPNGLVVKLWLPRQNDESTPPVARLLLFYVLLTGGAILLLTYVALRNLIVRPLGGLTKSAERLAAGTPHVQVAERGALEVRSLARAFNEMASQLRIERASLEQRLRELEEATGELKFTQRQLVHGEKLASVGRLAAGVAHEIGNPLSAVLGFVELLQDDGLTDAERAEFLTRIHKETNRINHIIRDLLDFARQGGESERLDVSSDVRAAIDDAVNLLRPQKELRGVEITINAPADLPRVVGAQHRLTQVMLNLLLNAADAMNGQGRIQIDLSADATNVTVVVTDTGPGLSSEIMGRLFEPFATTKAVGAGTGLGLAVSHTLIEGMGGTIAADNPAQGGARFTIRLVKSRGSMRPPSL